jgi:tetratricopeptide (TPR) repeat protein
MKWQIKRAVNAPLSGLPHTQRDYPTVLELKPKFILCAKPQASVLGALLGDNGFDVRYREDWQQLPPPPWKLMLAAPNPIEMEQAYRAEAALALRVLNVRQWRQPFSPGKLIHQLKQDNYPNKIQEAFAFALFDLKPPFDFENYVILDEWKSDVRRVIQGRYNFLPLDKKPQSVLLYHAYQLLALISQQRQQRLTSTEYLTAWDNFKQQATIKLPLIFAIVYWGEAAYRLTEIGNMGGAQQLLEKQTEAVKALLTQLPDLSDDLKGGLWRHHLGRLAYYRGEFAEALDQYRMEWQLHEQDDDALKARLQRSIASVLSDMGHLDSAKEQAEAALNKQQENNDSEEFKTLGRLGEIYARQGDYAQAIKQFTASWHKQADTTRDGQTAIYLGHVYLLQGDLIEAEKWYQQAATADAQQNIGFNPYLVMGQVALAHRQGQADTVQTFWQTHQQDLERLRSDKVLPPAVIATAVYLSDSQQMSSLDQYIRLLIEENYLIEVLYPLSLRFATPSSAMTHTEAILEGLRGWQVAIEALQQVTQEAASMSASETIPTPVSLLQALAVVQETDNWTALQRFLPRIYPMNLLCG